MAMLPASRPPSVTMNWVRDVCGPGATKAMTDMCRTVLFTLVGFDEPQLERVSRPPLGACRNALVEWNISSLPVLLFFWLVCFLKGAGNELLQEGEDRSISLGQGDFQQVESRYNESIRNSR